MEVRIKHPEVEGNSLGYTDIETENWDFDDNPVEFHETQPTKAATKWVNEFKKNPDQATWPTAKKT